MAWVTLAYPFTCEDGFTHSPDETLDLPQVQAAKLIRGGRARPATEPPKRSMDPAPPSFTPQVAESGADERETENDDSNS